MTDAVADFSIDVGRVGLPLCILRPEHLRDDALCRAERAASVATAADVPGAALVLHATQAGLPSGVLLTVVRTEWRRSDITTDELTRSIAANRTQLLTLLPLDQVEENVEPPRFVRGFPSATLRLDGTFDGTRYRLVAMLAFADHALYTLLLRLPASTPVPEASLLESVRVSRPGTLTAEDGDRDELFGTFFGLGLVVLGLFARNLGRPAEALGTTKDWDERWRETLRGKYWQSDRVRLPVSPFLHLVDWLDRPAWRRVLVVGCGISTEPALLAWLGYEVVAIDLSRVAIEHLEKRPAIVEELAAWLRIRRDPETNENRKFETAEALALLGPTMRGSLALLCADFRDFAPTQPFDVVYCPWSWQCLDADGRRELARRAFAWTAPGGACRIATQNLPKELSVELNRAFRDAGFFERDERFSAFLESGRNDRTRQASHRQAEIIAEDNERARARLDAGEKMYDVYNASG